MSSDLEITHCMCRDCYPHTPKKSDYFLLITESKSFRLCGFNLEVFLLGFKIKMNAATFRFFNSDTS